MAEHTKGKLEVSEEVEGINPSIYLEAPGWGTVATIGGGPLKVRRANAARLVAAWNSCDGIDTPTLERVRVDEQIGRLVGQRNLLLAACEQLVADPEPWDQSAFDAQIGLARQMARNAIAAAKES